MEGGGEPDDGGPWSNVQNRKNSRGRGDGIEWTFLVQNLSNKVTRNVLWRAFRPYGFVSDVYVARKRDSRGRCFGFVRYVGVENVKETLISMNSVIMFNMKVSVSLAKYDKDHKKINYSSDMLGRNVWRPKNGHQNNSNQDAENCNGGIHPLKNQVPNQGPSARSNTQDGRSFADVLKGTDRGVNNGAKVITVGGKGSLYPLHCVGRSVLGIAKEVMSVSKMRQRIEDEGMNEVGLSFIGGVSYLLTFRDKEFAKLCMELHEGFFNSVFSKFVLWNGEDIPYSRLVNLSITGVPFMIRDNTIFDNIGGMFGEVVQKSTFSWQEGDVSGGSVMVVTSHAPKIEEAVVIKWNERTFVSWVSESLQKRSPEVDVLSLLGSQDSESDMESESDYESIDMEDLEEGEIGQNDDTHDRRQDDASDTGRTVDVPVAQRVDQPVDQPVEFDKSVGHHESLGAQATSSEDVGGNLKNLHGKSPTVNIEMGNNYVHGEDVLSASDNCNNVGDPRNINSFYQKGGDKCCGPNETGLGVEASKPNSVFGEDGPTPSVNLGKRNLDERSPPSIGSMQGPSQKFFGQPNRSDPVSLDLNTPVGEDSGNEVCGREKLGVGDTDSVNQEGSGSDAGWSNDWCRSNWIFEGY
ncbi:putative RNA recognition motif domain, nucleotide-binding alpha-beta plait domain superfamily [Helianthus annuus]|nr:putative RNA recognition motif domain, nucleotide-binding alpha-beta plait domain superfamily [Helianthus annuus]KAJ0652097.1 putative RNA recognition motif domain, nucleotide-binding alpha-beta plait domain superfamily [Helianthus annuus]